MTGGILTFDIATATGWANASAEQVEAWPLVPLAVSDHPKVLYGEFRFRGDILNGPSLCQYQDDVADLLRLHRPRLIAYEAPLAPGVAEGSLARVRLWTLGALVVYTAARWQIPAIPSNVQTVRKHFVGQGRPKDPKVVVMDACRRRGWSPGTHNQADALAVLDWTVAYERRRAA